ncbi:MAG: tRNA lysidine(34) synthetase TilS [Oscillospiraceae bacterium]|nr:tRNA lysidine(34) synthetase TilS [Oscillospiraceae bacterium]
MLNKLSAFMAAYRGKSVVCAVSGGADSMALLWGLYLLKDKLDIRLSAAHFNHGLRGAESDRDEAFVRDFCAGYAIPFTAGRGNVTPGKKGLEAAAREARYAFLKSLPGLIATAHTADDNAETILMHLVRGTGLKGLGGIAPVNGPLIRPMLDITRTEVLAFLGEYSIPFVEDSSNAGDDFLRNRLRHHIMPLLKQENPCLSENLSAMATRLRQDAAALDDYACAHMTDRVSELQKMPPAVRSRVLAQHLLNAGVKEPEAAHIALLEKLVFSRKPSAKAAFPGGVTFTRRYDTLQVAADTAQLTEMPLVCPGVTELPGLRIVCSPNQDTAYNTDSVPVAMGKNPVVRARKTGDSLRLAGGTKSIKKLLIDRKIPAAQREYIPVIADDTGVLMVAGIGGNLDRLSMDEDAIRIQIQYL